MKIVKGLLATIALAFLGFFAFTQARALHDRHTRQALLADVSKELPVGQIPMSFVLRPEGDGRGRLLWGTAARRLTLALVDQPGAALNSTKPVTSVEEAMELVASFDGQPEDFRLAFPDALNDRVGINMALITDRILRRGWQPDGFTQAPGYRLYRYKKLS